MIKFFRQFRQRMIKENRVSRYLLYAIGEIVLVVVGILMPSLCPDPKGCANTQNR
ncbi:MAG: hypothetical protein IPH05_05715 [Flavobacteriales bacterium]|jgi:hypothetical protein|nr:hypothetical protein [Flavobacteriales bacterium]MBK6550876.1 hypothetical protein [Flavobacteriales bacterium]MBK6882431.1 hypothetical protein [Flavobacteriales bacterium]MBK7101355.1 hypothetical protein [Flavobacteriales bacterium]MBK7112063.1 hypothetical protein [Flavobacteriales bacterium]